MLDFADFLTIEPCTRAAHAHLFVGAAKAAEEAAAPDGAERVACRMDHYETPTQVHVTVYAKGVDRETSVIEIKETEVSCSALLCAVSPTPLILAPHADPSLPLAPSLTNESGPRVRAHSAPLRAHRRRAQQLHADQVQAGDGARQGGSGAELADARERGAGFWVRQYVWQELDLFRGKSKSNQMHKQVYSSVHKSYSPSSHTPRECTSPSAALRGATRGPSAKTSGKRDASTAVRLRKSSCAT